MSYSYHVKRVAGVGLLIAAAYGISFFGIPPAREIVYQPVPRILKEVEKSGYQGTDFSYMKVGEVTGKEFCTIPATTAVRNYFTKNGRVYEERTRIVRETCWLPHNVGPIVKVDVVFPYKPDDTSIEATFNGCRSFTKVKKGWKTSCVVPSDKSQLTYLAYQLIPPTGEKTLTRHHRKADRLDILLLKQKAPKTK